MADNEPNPHLFEDNVGRLVEQAMNGRPRLVLRAYGEMVDVLWKQGRSRSSHQARNPLEQAGRQ